jgi:hypothetical protein
MCGSGEVGGGGGRQVKDGARGDSQMIQLVDSMENTVGKHLVESFYGTIMIVDSLDHEGQGWSSRLVEMSLPKQLHKKSPIKLEYTV